MRNDRAIKIVTTAHRADDPRITHREGRSLAMEFDDVTLHARDRGSSAIPTILKFEPFGASSGRYKCFIEALRIGATAKRSVFHLHDPELFLLAPLLRARGHDVILDLHEDYPRQVYSKPYLNDRLKAPVSNVVYHVLRVLCKSASGVIVADAFVADNLGLKDAVAVRNFTAIAELPEITNLYSDRAPLVVSVGANTVERCFPEMLDAASLLPEFQFRLAGIVKPDLHKRYPATANVEFPGWLNRGEAMNLVSRARVGWALLQDLPQYRLAMPTKVFEYMLSGIPVVVSEAGQLGKMVSKVGCGLAVDSSDASAVAEATRVLLRDTDLAQTMATKGKEYATKHYEWGTESSALVGLYRCLGD